MMCQTLGSGLNLHLAENELLREVFQLGPKLILGDNQMLKQSKLERVSSDGDCLVVDVTLCFVRSI